MLQADQIAREEERLSGSARCPQAKVPTYQDLLDQALDDTFPASDPLAIGAATHVHEPRTTARDSLDWTLRPGACPATGQPSDDDGHGSPQSAGCEASACCDLFLDDLHLPAGPCRLQQSAEEALLSWTDRDGQPQQQRLSLERLRQLLAKGLLQRHDPK